MAHGAITNLTTYLYQYSFPLNSSKTFTGFTLPNNPNVIMMAALITVSPSNTSPTLAAISNYNITADSTLVFTNTASDTDQPPQLLTFAVSSGPAGANVDPYSGVFTWRPTIAQTGTNSVAIVVSDNATPSLSATQTFNVVVTRPAQPSMQQLTATNSQFQSLITGPSGPDYYVQASGDLSNWTTIHTNLSATVPFLWSDTNRFSKRFYRVLLGP